MRANLILPVLAVLCLTGFAVTGDAQATVTCTNNAGVSHTWTVPASSGGGSGGVIVVSGSAPGRSVSKGDPTTPMSFAQLQWVMVGSSIADGTDPITAARLFGPWTVPGGTPAQIAHAQDPATYGWRC